MSTRTVTYIHYQESLSKPQPPNTQSYPSLCLRILKMIENQGKEEEVRKERDNSLFASFFKEGI